MKRHRHHKYVKPEDGQLVELDERSKLSESQQLQEKFIGNALWAVFDVITFGAFERKGEKQKR